VAERRYTAAQLLADAAAAESPASGRLITDWVAKGLLDHPRKRGLGRGRGTIATWPEDQRRLFLALLDQRRRGVKRQATLCNLPVTLWLDSEGLDHDLVPLRQVRRCLTTWVTAHKASPVRAARYTAELLIEQQGAPHISRRASRSLIDAVSRATSGAGFDRELLYDAARRAFDSERFAGLWLRTIQARFTAIERLGEIGDETYEAARLAINRSVPAYVEQQLAASPGEDETLVKLSIASELASTACLSLVTMLGFLELAREQSPTIPDKSAPRPRQQPGAMTPKEAPFDATQHATARRRAGRESPQKASAG
jgi:hypothetical protein